MRYIFSILIDIVIILSATLAAVVLRDNFEVSMARTVTFLPYLLFTAFVSAMLLPIFRVNRAIWRFASMPDFLRIGATLTATIVCTVLLVFAFNRLDGIPRSLPFLQFNVAIIALIGARVMYKIHHNARKRRRSKFAPFMVADEAATETALLVGLSRLTETYLQSMLELAPRAVRIVGILGRQERHVGRLVASHKVLGLPEHLNRILGELEVNGIAVDRIVITASAASLSPKARKAIAEVQRRGSVAVQYLAEQLGFEKLSRQDHLGGKATGNSSAGALEFEIQPDELVAMRRRRYWRFKRATDVAASLFLLCISAPLLILIGIAIAASIGWPLFFWQQRPGLGARPFHLYKFRTMGAALASDGRRLSDEERVSRVGNFLRRTRLDELPQLFNILRGEMSFIGPRPLLAQEQHESYRARLLVRPGLSGWAQVVGGRAISAADKAALDVWYVRNASLLLDVAIVLRTMPMVFFGERISERLIERAWHDLSKAGVLKGRLAEMRAVHPPLAA